MAEDAQIEVGSDEPEYYTFMAEMGVPYFHFGGLRSTDELVEMLDLDENSRVLIVGVGTGYSACHIVQSIGCRIVGIDIAEKMIEKSTTRAEDEGLSGQIEFQVADAHKLPFEDQSFDAVMTEFVTIFLDIPSVLVEYMRVLKPGGLVGINELFKADEMPDAVKQEIEEAEIKLQDAIRLPFVLPTPLEWKDWFESAGMVDVILKEIDTSYDSSEYIKALGGKARMVWMVLKSIYHLITNRRMRPRLMKMGTNKNLFIRNKRTREYVGSVFLVGRKP